MLKTTEAGVGDLAGLNGVSVADYDIDGDLDLYGANGFLLQPAFENRLFINSLSNTGAVSFSSESNLADTNGTAEARAFVVFDYDDRDLDLIVANHQRSRIVNSDDPWPYLYENVNSTLNWIKIDLEGTISIRSGFGGRFDSLPNKTRYTGIMTVSAFCLRVFDPCTSVSVRQHSLMKFRCFGQAVLWNRRWTCRPIKRYICWRGRVCIELFNLLGQKVHSAEIIGLYAGSHRTHLDMSDLAPGIYYFRLSDGARERITPAYPLIRLQ